MTFAAILLLTATFAAVGGARVLTHLRHRGIGAAALMSAWTLSLSTPIVCVVLATVVVSWPDHLAAEVLAERLAGGFTAVVHAAQPWLDAATIATLVTVLVLIAGRIALLTRRLRHRCREVRRLHYDVLPRLDAVSAPQQAHDVIWIDATLPMAYSVAGRPGFIVATAGLAERLPWQQREAVLAHERAHLQSGHHRLIAACEILAGVFGRIPLYRASVEEVALLAELAADRTAARAVTPAAVGSALRTVSDAHHSQDISSRISEEVLTVRLRALTLMDVKRQAAFDGWTAVLVPLGAAVLPAVVAFAAVSLALCYAWSM